jgi:pantoate--beta-alanine ligase
MRIDPHHRRAAPALAGARTAFVPTMGNLHDGHLSLVERAQGPAAGGREHLRQPAAVRAARGLRHLPAHARARLRAAAQRRLRLVFAPDEAELYPEPQASRCSRPALADILEGHFRPGFFTGVCTVVLKLFNCVQPRVAVFGKKDYQQLMVIRQMVRQLGVPIEIVAGETTRAERRPGAVVAQRLSRRRAARRGARAVRAS